MKQDGDPEKWRTGPCSVAGRSSLIRSLGALGLVCCFPGQFVSGMQSH